ncbi:MAG: hypothetical protein LIO93_03615 [Bacteroidales bacterium]|nr:hypothetical protein [Bacteroidales bacterium]
MKIRVLTFNYSGYYKIWVFLIITMLFINCNGYRCANGVIYDSTTKLPLDSVHCIVLTGNEEQFSDSLGRYSLCNSYSGCIPDCPDIEIEYSKKGYKTKRAINPGKENIYLDKEQ